MQGQWKPKEEAPPLRVLNEWVSVLACRWGMPCARGYLKAFKGRISDRAIQSQS